MLNKEDYEQIDNLIMSAEAVCNAVSDYSSDLKRAYINKAIEHIAADRELQEKLINKYFKDLA